MSGDNNTSTTTETGNVNTTNTSSGHRRSSTGRSSRKNSTEDKRPSRPQNKGQSQTTTTLHNLQQHVQAQNQAAQNTRKIQPEPEVQVHVRAQAGVEQQQQQHNLIKDKPLPPGTGLSPMKDTNIVDSIAACVDKYTTKNNSTSKPSTRPLPTISKDLTQPLTVLTSNEKVRIMP